MELVLNVALQADNSGETRTPGHSLAPSAYGACHGRRLSFLCKAVTVIACLHARSSPMTPAAALFLYIVHIDMQRGWMQLTTGV